MSRSRRLLVALTLAPLVVHAISPASAQSSYPSQPVRVVVPFPPGGTADTLPRALADQLSRRFGQPFIVDNKPGAAGNVGSALVANAPPDGYTLLAAPPPPLVINQSIYPKLAFDPSRFVPVTVLASVPNVLVVSNAVSATTLGELIAHARSHPGKLNYASTGNGGTPHLSGEWFKQAAEIQLTHVPYKGVAQAIVGMGAGEVHLMFMNLADALPLIRAGRLRALAVGGSRRTETFPDVPAVSETFPGFISTTWYAIVAPPGTPSDLGHSLSAAISDVLRDPQISMMLKTMHLEPVGGTPEQTAAFLQQETERWTRIIRSARITAD